MTFTKEPPTKPGFYAWRSEPSGKPMALTVQAWMRGLIVFAHPQCMPPTVQELGGEWCRLVPADEIEKAWNECARCDGISWYYSRARRVMEGEE